MLQKKMKCEICRNHRADRFCMRKAKNICWHCCNDMRADGKCPKECKFKPYIKNNTQHIKVYSQTELIDFFSKEANHWFITPDKIFDGKSPMELMQTEEGKEKLEIFFQVKKIPLLQVAKIYKKRFNINSIDLSEYPPYKENHEDVAKKFMDALILQDKDLILNFLENKSYKSDKEAYDNFLQRLYSQRKIKKLKRYDLLTASTTRDNKQGLVTFEINGKNDFSLYLLNTNDGWKVIEIFFATEQEYISFLNLMKKIGELLSNGKFSEAYGYLQPLEKVFFNNSHLYYLYATYYELNNNLTLAVEKLEIACELDPDFIPYHEKLSELYIRKEKLKKAEKVLTHILKKDKNNLMALNNLAILFVRKGLYDDARALYEQCLKIDPDFKVAKDNLERLKNITLQNPFP